MKYWLVANTAFLIVVGCQGNSSTPTPMIITPTPVTPTPTVTTPVSATCIVGDQIPFVYNDFRLTVVDGCISVIGRVMFIRLEKDGDYHIVVDLTQQDKHYLEPGNANTNTQRIPMFVVEPICETTPTQPDAIQPCSGDRSPLPMLNLKVGDCAQFMGRHVKDTQHFDWGEIHPAGKIAIVDSSLCPVGAQNLQNIIFTIPED